MTVRRGDIVLLAFPFSDGVGTKVRPVLFVQNDGNNRRLKNTIVVMITSTTKRATAAPTQILIDLNTPEGQEAGLVHNSAITCENVFTVAQQRIMKTLGRLPAAVMVRVDLCLKESLGLAAK
jgi:mRNA interferase MazF